jgi:HEAT repeat protein
LNVICKLLVSGALAGLTALGAGGCGSPSYPEGLHSLHVQERLEAVVEAGNRRDMQAVPALVDLLDDEDEGVRFYAILALEKITGTRRGYDYAGSAVGQMRSIQRWRHWLETEYTPLAEAVKPTASPPALSAVSTGPG